LFKGLKQLAAAWGLCVYNMALESGTYPRAFAAGLCGRMTEDVHKQFRQKGMP